MRAYRLTWLTCQEESDGGGDNLKIIAITDAPCPAIFFQLGEGEPFDEELTRVAEECEKEAAANATD